MVDHSQFRRAVRRKVIVIIVAVVLFGAIGLLLLVSKSFQHAKARAEPPFEDTTAFAGTREIRFSQRNTGIAPDQEMIISDSNTLNRLLAAVRLQRKEPCLCAHLLEANFQTASGNIFVSFCDHCFDIQKTRGSYEEVRLYRMPKDFYTMFCNLAQAQTNGWLLHNP
jgi:hypothetical protein